MPDPAALVTPADVAAGSGGQVTAEDPRLPVLIAAATDAIRLWCGWHVAPVITETLTLDGEGSPSLRIPSGRVLDVSAVRIDGETQPKDTWDFSQAGMLRLRHGTFPDRFRSIDVDLTHGYQTAPALAAVITRAVLATCASPMGATREQAGSISITWARAGMTLSGEDRADLAPYRLQQWT